jgi:CheY-like chemotaxis protein
MDKGSRVVIRAAGSAAAARPRPPTPGGRVQDGLTARVLPDPDRLRVLVADDDADTADSLALLLRLWGHDVRAAYEGVEALALAFFYLPDVLLLDVAMPGLDGFRLARLVRSQPRLDGAVLVAVTGYADDAHRQMGLRAGFDHYLVKPVEPAVIVALLLTAGGRGGRVSEGPPEPHAPRRSVPCLNPTPKTNLAATHPPRAGGGATAPSSAC